MGTSNKTLTGQWLLITRYIPLTLDGILNLTAATAADVRAVYDAVQSVYPALLMTRPRAGQGSGTTTLVRILHTLLESHSDLFPQSFEDALEGPSGAPTYVTGNVATIEHYHQSTLQHQER